MLIAIIIKDNLQKRPSISITISNSIILLLGILRKCHNDNKEVCAKRVTVAFTTAKSGGNGKVLQ